MAHLQRTVPQAPAEGLPAMLRGQESPFMCQRCLPVMLGVPFQPERNVLKGRYSLCFISAETRFLLGDREKRMV